MTQDALLGPLNHNVQEDQSHKAALPQAPDSTPAMQGNGLFSRRKVTLPDANDQIPVEKVLIRMLQNELGVQKVRMVDHFTDAGGNSFHAVRLTSRIFDAFGVRLPANSLLAGKSLQAVAQQIESKVLEMIGHLSYEAIDAIWDRAAHKKIVVHKDPGFDLRHPDAPREALAPAQLVLNGAISARRTLIPGRKPKDPIMLCPIQEKIWAEYQSDPGNPLFNLSFAWHLNGWVDERAMESAFRTVIRRHEILRTSFHQNDQGPAPRILPGAIFNLETADFPKCPEPVIHQYLSSWMQSQTQIPFCLSKPPLIRARLVRLAPRKQVLLVVVHQMVFDSWSVAALSRELSLHYKNAVAGRRSDVKALPIQFFDFAAWDRKNQTSPALASQTAFWEEKLATPPAALDLPYDQKQNVAQPTTSDQTPVCIEADLAQALRNLAKRKGTTLFTVLLAVYKTWLRYYTGQDDITVGTDVARRARPGAETLLGPLANPVLVRTELSGHLHFSDILGKVIDETGQAFENVDVFVDAARKQKQPRVMFSYLDRECSLEIKGVKVRYQKVNRGHVEELCMDLQETQSGTIEGHLHFATHRFNKDRIAKMAQHFVAMANRAANHRDPNKDTGSFSKAG